MSLADKFPAKFAVNSLPYTDNKRTGIARHQRGKGPKQGDPKKSGRDNPNLIPISAKCSGREDLITHSERSWELEREDFAHGTNTTDEPHPYDPSEWH